MREFDNITLIDQEGKTEEVSLLGIKEVKKRWTLEHYLILLGVIILALWLIL